MSEQLFLHRSIQKWWRQRVLPRKVAKKLLRPNTDVVRLSRPHVWSIRIPGEERLKVKQLCRRTEHRLRDHQDRSVIIATCDYSQDNKLVAITLRRLRPR